MENKITQKVEVRANQPVITTADPGQLTMPQIIFNEILKIGGQKTSVAAMTNIFQSDGNLKFFADLGVTPAGFYTEQNPPIAQTNNLNLKEIHIIKNRIASVIQTSKNWVSLTMQPQSEKHVEEYLLAKSILLGIEDKMFNSGDAEGKTGLQNVILHNNAVDGTNFEGKVIARHKIEDISIVTGTGVGVLAYKDLMDAYIKFVNQNLPENLNGAIWVVEDISKLANVKDDTGASVLKFGNKAQGIPDTVFGIPVIKTEKFTEGQKVGTILMNPKKAYAVTVSEQRNQSTKVDGDTIQSLKGGTLYVGDTYVGGKVVNPRAIVIVKTA
ncbi:hypothetical protein ABE26_21510 [Cytobacillus firmus]|nr:hypothetical protein [Cytobacillus firmus]